MTRTIPILSGLAVAAALFAGAATPATASEAPQAVNAAPMAPITVAKKHAKKKGNQAKPKGMDKFKGNGNPPLPIFSPVLA